MKLRALPGFLGLALLLAVFATAAWRVFQNSRGPGADGSPAAEVVRFGHWQLEAGLRDAFDLIARDYERLHPGVRIETIAVPERVFNMWLRTRLVGGDAPDLVQMQVGRDDILARYFLPLTPWLEEPNPYNHGTDLADLPWRETFVDGLRGPPNYVPGLFDYYAVANSMFTTRLYVNVTLLHRVAPGTPPPANLEDLRRIHARVLAHNSDHATRLLTLAGSRETMNLLQRAFAAATQRPRALADPLNPFLESGTARSQLAWARDTLSLASPDLAPGLEILRELAAMLPTGFAQLTRDDAMFQFSTGQALFWATGSWDLPSVRSSASFEVAFAPLPLPSSTDPVCGPGVLGVLSEAGLETRASFSLNRASPHPERAVDFLRYMTSRVGNQTFTRASGWFPAVRGVAPAPEIAVFAPVVEGFQEGIRLPELANARLAWETALHALIEPSGSVENFAKTAQAPLRRGVLRDMRGSTRHRENNLRRQDAQFIALALDRGQASALSPAARDRRLREIAEAQAVAEVEAHWLRSEIDAQAVSMR
jgi:raffinose/stachyose/melibiose transport system substrate-binding protein